jgi:hypothetical protein
VNYTYGWKCICKSEMEMHITKLTYIPECLQCGELMFMMYSIDPDGAIWMNKALLLMSKRYSLEFNQDKLHTPISPRPYTCLKTPLEAFFDCIDKMIYEINYY